ncbi:rRNA-processing protein EBP2 [Savitreella phatthalungensis]
MVGRRGKGPNATSRKVAEAFVDADVDEAVDRPTSAHLITGASLENVGGFDEASSEEDYSELAEILNEDDSDLLVSDDSDSSVDEVNVASLASMADVDALEALSDEEAEADEVALSDVESLDRDAGDVQTRIRETINNTRALQAALDRIRILPPAEFSLHQVLTTDEAVEIQDVNDDLNRELAFYKQGLLHARKARQLVLDEGAPWSRPADYFAEMVKSDAHMEKVQRELVKEATSKKLSAEAKRQRELKKFGKQVQVDKQLQRQKQKRELDDKLKQLKRKRGAGSDIALEGNDDFDIALDEAVANKGDKKGSRSRDQRNAKFGYGGKKRFSKSNTSESTLDFGGARRGGMGAGRGERGFSRRGGGRGAHRPGKSKRQRV